MAHRVSVLVGAFNFSTAEVESGRCLCMKPAWSPNKFQDSQDNVETPCLKKT